MAESTFSCCAYCWKEEKDWSTVLHFKCDGCGKFVHFGCIKSSQPSALLGDAFYYFKCESCGEENKEEFNRMEMSWRQVITLVLYNLHKTGQGRCGYFHWRAHICFFIDMHWYHIFGNHRKKTALWSGTIAGNLSSGSSTVFQSGLNVIEAGYWRLTSITPPIPHLERSLQKIKYKRNNIAALFEHRASERVAHKTGATALKSAIELKGKRVTALTETRKKMRTSSDTNNSSLQTSHNPEQFSGEIISSILQQEELNVDEESDLDIDIESMVMGPLSDMKDLRPASPDVNTLLDIEERAPPIAGKSPVKKEIKTATLQNSDQTEMEGDDEKGLQGRDERGDENSNESVMGRSEDEESDDDDDDDEDDDEEEEQEKKLQHENAGTEAERGCNEGDSNTSDSVPGKRKRKLGRPRKRRRDSDLPPASPPQSLKRISLFEEGELLNKLNALAEKQSLNPELAQLRRKLLCNKTNREYGLPVFDLDAQMEKVTMKHSLDQVMKRPEMHLADVFLPKLTSRSSQIRETRDLDRFMMKDHVGKMQSRTYSRFHQRLVGLEDKDLKPFVSPYTTRTLMPFIWRNYSTKCQPLKMRLIQEIKSYPHRNDPSWKPEATPPIDYCYVRPEHIPSVNALCREFFWPGIDMSECLQYPDFSCVVLYRKIVIGFAFMVPDRGYNEAYISFIFTHPEWRNVGIASFMLYHLIQTCMGKDVLLHVSASSPAMLLYQKFGFKAQDFILNFYYRYFPLESPDSHHAFLMRLNR